MSRIGVALNISNSKLGSYSFTGPATVVDPLNGATTAALQATLATDQATLVTAQATLATAQTAFEATLATLVADGASPTQAHVTAANSAYTTMKTALTAVTTDLATVTTDITNLNAAIGPSPAASDVVVSLNIAHAPTVSVVEIAFLHILRALRGSSYLQP